MNKRGFTLIEIIISIALISLVATISIVALTRNNSKTNKLNQKIYEAANVFIATETDENGNTYEFGLENGAKAVQLTVQNLVDKGYLSNTIVNELKNSTKQNDLSKLFVLASISIKTDNDNECGSGLINYSNSWDKDKQDPVYLCPYDENASGNNYTEQKVEAVKGIELTPISVSTPDFHYKSPADSNEAYIPILKDNGKAHTYYKNTKWCNYHISNWDAIITNEPYKNCNNSRTYTSDVMKNATFDSDRDYNNNNNLAYLVCKKYSLDNNGDFNLSECKISYEINNSEYRYTCLTVINNDNKSKTEDSCKEMYDLYYNGGTSATDCTWELYHDGVVKHDDTTCHIKRVNDSYGIITSKKNDTKVLINKTYDLDGTSYYYRGNPTNNYVKLKNGNNLSNLFQIVRKNGDGTLRLMSVEDSINNVYYPKDGKLGTIVPGNNEWEYNIIESQENSKKISINR